MNSKFKMNEKTVTTLLYVGAAVLVVAILCVSIFAFVSQSRKKKNPQDTTSNGVVTTEQIPSDNDPVTSQNAQDTQPTPDTSKNTENVSDDDPDEVVFRNPAEGAVAKNHDTETLVYSVTMNDYRVHCGVDIAAAVGTPVYSVADGTITRIYDDYLMGKCIEIDHGNGYVTKYMHNSEVAIADDVINAHRQIIESCKNIRVVLNPEIAERQRLEKENSELKTQLKELRESQSEMKSMMASLLEQLGSPVKKS